MTTLDRSVAGQELTVTGNSVVRAVNYKSGEARRA